MRLTSAAFWSVAVAAVLCSCGQADTSQIEQETKELAQEETVQEMPERESSSVLPSAFHISGLFKKSGLEFSEGLTNSPSNVEKYNSRVSKLLNFGVYSADLFYCVLNDQNQLSKEYIAKMKKLSEETGMGEIFNTDNLLKRFEANVGNKDSVMEIILQVQEQTDMYVERSNEEHTAMVIFSGAWIEGMYVGITSYGSNKNEELGKRLSEQAYMLEPIIRGLTIYPGQSEELTTFVSGLTELNQLFISSENYSEGAFQFDENSLTEAELNALTGIIGRVRNNITLSES